MPAVGLGGPHPLARRSSSSRFPANLCLAPCVMGHVKRQTDLAERLRMLISLGYSLCLLPSQGKCGLPRGARVWPCTCESLASTPIVDMLGHQLQRIAEPGSHITAGSNAAATVAPRCSLLIRVIVAKHIRHDRGIRHA
jgi:hypothetical protein